MTGFGHTRWPWPWPSAQNIIFSIYPLALSLQPRAGDALSSHGPTVRRRRARARANLLQFPPQLPIRYEVHMGVGQSDGGGHLPCRVSYFYNYVPIPFFWQYWRSPHSSCKETWHSLRFYIWGDKTCTPSTLRRCRMLPHREVPTDMLGSHTHPYEEALQKTEGQQNKISPRALHSAWSWSIWQTYPTDGQSKISGIYSK